MVYSLAMTPSNPVDGRYTLTELADLAGVTPRTVRYYLAQGLLPAVGAAGPGAKYNDAHLDRLRLIRRLQGEHQPLAAIRKELEGLDDDAIRAATLAPAPPPQPGSALDYIRSLGQPTRPARLARSSGSLLKRMDVPLPAMFSEAPASPPPSPPLNRSQWDRVPLGPDVELHIRRPLTRSDAKRVDRLIEIARDLLSEDQP